MRIRNPSFIFFVFSCNIFCFNTTFFAKFNDKINEIEKADLYIIAVSDKSIIEISKSLKVSTGCVVHTSGSIEMNVLNKFKNLLID